MEAALTDENKLKGAQQRQHFRIKFPDPERPLFTHKDKSYLVIDAAEEGLAIAIEEGDPIGTFTGIIKGSIKFKDKESCNIVGKRLRNTPNSVVLKLSIGIPLATIMKQQRILLQKYGQIGG
jgi:hypothetical protein